MSETRYSDEDFIKVFQDLLGHLNNKGKNNPYIKLAIISIWIFCQTHRKVLDTLDEYVQDDFNRALEKAIRYFEELQNQDTSYSSSKKDWVTQTHRDTSYEAISTALRKRTHFQKQKSHVQFETIRILNRLFEIITEPGYSEDELCIADCYYALRHYVRDVKWSIK